MRTVFGFRLVGGILLVLLLLAGGTASLAASKDADPGAKEAISAAKSPQEIDAVLARLSDREIRELLIGELGKIAAVKSTLPEKKTGLGASLREWLHAIDNKNDESGAGGVRLLPFFLRIPGEVGRALLQIGDGQFDRLLLNLFLILLSLGVGLGVEWFLRRITGGTLLQAPPPAGEEDEGMNRLWGACVALLPAIVYLTFFVAGSLVFFFILDIDLQPVRAAFMALLGTILGGRGLSLLSRFFCSPGAPALRLLPLDDALAEKVHKGFQIFTWYTATAMMALTFLRDAGISKGPWLALGAVLGTLLLLLIAGKIVLTRRHVTEAILTGEEGQAPNSWAMRQFASMWHVFALLYLFGIWSIWINTLITRTGKDNGALIISLLIVPLYLILDRIGYWLIGNIVSTLGIKREEEPDEQKKAALSDAYLSPEQKERRLKQIMQRVFRAFLVLVLFVWVMTLWGFDFPFATNIVQSAFDILITLTLALFIWRFISRIIERKITESMPEQEEEDVNESDEFGSAKQLGRSYTLLPMIRKFIATTLLVMVALIVLSSIGVDIAPLLAGAGVIGLAIGFGAQKLVSDVLSGVFYLLDDAFRVGEYIQAGSVKGAVENITLRNVMLRHHRGMLQIVPHSDLGSITNFMRGGIVVKFNLEFPYDTDVEVVRKVIKKVGQAMLQDEELGPDFILPVKSQGVYEISNSVMVIRVKFTAKPGRQFLIRRDAYRRISDALAAKGIHYAHRKVIVEVPQVEDKSLTEEQVREAAGAAAGQQLAAEEKAKQNAAATNTDPF